MPEALEKWPVERIQDLVPRHMEIIVEINCRFLEQVRAMFPDDEARVGRVSIFEEWDGRRVRRAHLATVGSFAVNGVARLHSDPLRTQTLSDFAAVSSTTYGSAAAPTRRAATASAAASVSIVDNTNEQLGMCRGRLRSRSSATRLKAL